MTVGSIVIVVVLAILVFAIAAGAIGREARRLDKLAPRAVYIVEEAAQYVADALPPLSQAQLTHAEVEGLLLAHMRWLHAKGLQPDAVTDRPQDITDHPVVVEDTTAVGYVIGVAEAAGLELDDVDIAHIVEAHLAYFAGIGAVGPEAADPDVPMRQLPSGVEPGRELGRRDEDPES
ncbi:MAG: hypothetical protein AB7Q42_01140 [Acidimicrobiia bacterium]